MKSKELIMYYRWSGAVKVLVTTSAISDCMDFDDYCETRPSFGDDPMDKTMVYSAAGAFINEL